MSGPKRITRRLGNLSRAGLIDAVRAHVANRYRRIIDLGDIKVLGVFAAPCSRGFIVIRVVTHRPKREITYLGIAQHRTALGFACIAGPLALADWRNWTPGLYPCDCAKAAGRCQLRAKARLCSTTT